MKVLVIGGTDFIGPRVVGRLLASGHEPAVYHRGATRTALPEGVEEVLGDRRGLAEHADELRRLAPEVVLDMIPMNEHDARGVMRVVSTTMCWSVFLKPQSRCWGRRFFGKVTTSPLQPAAFPISRTQSAWGGGSGSPTL